jgi:hypothetical protein
MSVSRFVFALMLPLASACRSADAPPAGDDRGASVERVNETMIPVPEDELVSGCVSTDRTMLDELAACTRNSGASFVFDEDIERELAQTRITWISCFVSAGTKRSDIESVHDSEVDVEMIQHAILRGRAHDSDLMIDREPLPGTHTYRIYRLPK